MRLPILVLLTCLSWPMPTEEAELLGGPIPATVVRVVDGDTLVVRARVWLGQDVETHVRLADIDAPELRARCPEERALAERARDFLAEAVAGGEVRLTGIRYGKYAGRVVAAVGTLDTPDIGDLLVASGLARRSQRGARASWCE